MIETETIMEKKPHHILHLIEATQGLSETKLKKIMSHASASVEDFTGSLVNKAYNKELLTELRLVRAGLEELALTNPATVNHFSAKYEWLCNAIKVMTVDLAK